MKFLKSLLQLLAAGLFAAGISIVCNSDVGRATFYKWSQTANTNATADSTINWAEGMAPSAVNDSARAMMAATAKYRDDVSGKLVSGGTATAYTLFTNQVFTSLTAMDGASLSFLVNTLNGANATLNVDSLGAKPLHSALGVTALPAGTLAVNGIYTATYFNANNAWLVHNIASASIIPAGTKIVTTSSACPSGFTLDGTNNDRTLVMSSFAGGSTGGTTGFTAAFNGSTAGGSTALTLANLPSWTLSNTLGVSITDPSHTHTVTDPTHVHANTFNDAQHQHQPPNLVTAAISGASAGTVATGTYTAGTSAGGLTSAAYTGASITNAAIGTGITNAAAYTGISGSITGTITSGGSGTAHTHPNSSIQYVFAIACTKN